jgi:hypothetical protein
MAHANPELIQALRRTAQKLSIGNPYQWGHMGSCNCGNLAQELTQLTKAQIHEFAMQGRGDWREQVEEFCPTSGLPMDLTHFGYAQSWSNNFRLTESRTFE